MDMQSEESLDLNTRILQTPLSSKVPNFGSPLHLLTTRKTYGIDLVKKRLSFNSERSPGKNSAFIESQREDLLNTSDTDDSLDNGSKFQASKKNSITDLTRAISVPKILEYMCEYILEHGDDVNNLFHRPADKKMLTEVKDQFANGLFYDCGSVVVIASLLKFWLRELPKPLVPHTNYNRAIDIVVDYLNDCTNELMNIPEFKRQSATLQEEDIWGFLWEHEPQYVSYDASKALTLAKLIEEYAFGSRDLNRNGMDLQQQNDENQSITPSLRLCLYNISQWFESLPEINQNCLEYLCIFFYRFSHVSVHCPLDNLASTFAPHILKPAFVNGEEEERKRSKYLKQKFLFLLIRKFQWTIVSKLHGDGIQQIHKDKLRSSVEGFDKRGWNASAIVTNTVVDINSIAKINLADQDKYSQPLPNLNQSQPSSQNPKRSFRSNSLNYSSDSAEESLSSSQTIPEENQVFARHFSPEWELDSGQFVDEQGTILYRHSNFLRYSPNCHNWLNEAPRKLCPQFRKQQADEATINSFFESDPNLVYEAEEKLPPGKGLLIKDFSQPHRISDVSKAQVSIRKEPPLFQRGNTCQGCRQNFNIISRRKRNCHYCGILLCEGCCTAKYPIPSRVVTEGDFEPHSLCATCEAFLSKYLGVPFVSLESLSEPFRVAVGKEKFKLLKEVQTRLVHIIYDVILPDCPTKLFLLGLIPPQYVSFLCEGEAKLSMIDLYAIKVQQFFPYLDNMFQLYTKHIKKCEYCGPKQLHSTSMDM